MANGTATRASGRASVPSKPRAFAFAAWFAIIVPVDAFLSHNRADKEVARQLGAQLTLAGAYVWFDDWEVRAGDSIPGKVNDALASVDTLIVVWSANAQGSEWVRAELETAIARALEDHTFRVVCVRLDETSLPALLRPKSAG
jgi:hypothetical protein